MQIYTCCIVPYVLFLFSLKILLGSEIQIFCCLDGSPVLTQSPIIQGKGERKGRYLVKKVNIFMGYSLVPTMNKIA